MTITEIVLLSLKPGLDIETPGSEGEESGRYIFTTISSQPGCQRVSYGREVEKPDVLEVIIGVFPKLNAF
jgi:hypothetical protein